MLLSKLQYFIKEFTQKFRNRNSKNSFLWINAEILKGMKERDLAKKKEKKANKSKLCHDKHNFTMLRSKVTSMLRKSRAEHNKQSRGQF